MLGKTWQKAVFASALTAVVIGGAALTANAATPKAATVTTAAVVKVVCVKNSNHLTYIRNTTCLSGETKAPAIKGDKGSTGLQGLVGIQGPKGDTGIPGKDGSTCPAGYTPEVFTVTYPSVAELTNIKALQVALATAQSAKDAADTAVTSAQTAVDAALAAIATAPTPADKDAAITVYNIAKADLASKLGVQQKATDALKAAQKALNTANTNASAVKTIQACVKSS